MPKSSTTNRILALDLLRGYFIAVIIIDHLFRFPNLFEYFTGRGELWVSAAEGFFIISGMLVGLIYSQKPPITLIRRAGWLYFLSIFFTLLFTIWGHFLPRDEIVSGLWSGGSFVNLIWKTISLQYVYGWTDYLSFYAVFMLFAPLGLLICKKAGGLTLVLVSILLWLCRGHNAFLAWQLLFFTGLAVGRNLSILESKASALNRNLRKLLTGLLVCLSLITVALSVVIVFGLRIRESAFFDKATVGFGRFTLSWIWFTTVFIFIRKYESKITRYSSGFFETLGRNSLFAYCLHAVLLFPLNLIFPYTESFLKNTLLTALVLGIIWMAIMFHQRLKTVSFGYLSR